MRYSGASFKMSQTIVEDEEEEEEEEEQEYESCCSEEVYEDDGSITMQVKNIEDMMTQSDIDGIKTTLLETEKTLEEKQSQIMHLDETSKEKDELISKFKLERDLAEAERRMTKHQMSVLLGIKENLDLGTAKFYSNSNESNEVLCPNDIESFLFGDSKDQTKLHREILYHLKIRGITTKELPFSTKNRYNEKLKNRLNFKRQLSKSIKVLKTIHCCLHRRRNNQSYHAIQEYNGSFLEDDHVVPVSCSSNKVMDDDNTQLIRQIQRFETMSSDKLKRILHFIRSQSNHIHLLQNEMAKLMSVNDIGCDESTFCASSDGHSTTSSSCSSDCFVSVDSESVFSLDS